MRTGLQSTEGQMLLYAPDSTPTSPCPPPTATTQLLQHDVYGYCLLYPAGSEVVRQSAPVRFIHAWVTPTG